MPIKVLCVALVSAACLLGIAWGSTRLPESDPTKNGLLVLASDANPIPPVVPAKGIIPPPRFPATPKSVEFAPRRVVANKPLPFFKVSVARSPDLDPESRCLYQMMSAALSEFNELPASRADYHSNLKADLQKGEPAARYQLNHWKGMIHDVTSIGNGSYLVYTRVDPVLTNSSGEQATLVLCGFYYEIYLVDRDGVATYLGAESPAGLANPSFMGGMM